MTIGRSSRVRPATIYDVAEVAGVSHQTVSRLMRGFKGIRPDRPARVETAIAELVEHLFRLGHRGFLSSGVDLQRSGHRT